MTIFEIKPHRGGWQCAEHAGGQPYERGGRQNTSTPADTQSR